MFKIENLGPKHPLDCAFGLKIQSKLEDSQARRIVYLKWGPSRFGGKVDSHG